MTYGFGESKMKLPGLLEEEDREEQMPSLQFAVLGARGFRPRGSPLLG